MLLHVEKFDTAIHKTRWLNLLTVVAYSDCGLPSVLTCKFMLGLLDS